MICNVTLRQILRNKKNGITTLNNFIYSSAKSVTPHLGIRITEKNVKHVNISPKWKVAIQTDTESLWAYVSVLDRLARWVNIKTKQTRKSNKHIKTYIQPSNYWSNEYRWKPNDLGFMIRETNFIVRKNRILRVDTKKIYRIFDKRKKGIKEPAKTEDMEEGQ